MEADATPTLVQGTIIAMATVEVLQEAFTTNISDLNWGDIIVLKAMWNKKSGKGLIDTHGCFYIYAVRQHLQKSLNAKLCITAWTFWKALLPASIYYSTP